MDGPMELVLYGWASWIRRERKCKVTFKLGIEPNRLVQNKMCYPQSHCFRSHKPPMDSLYGYSWRVFMENSHRFDSFLFRKRSKSMTITLSITRPMKHLEWWKTLWIKTLFTTERLHSCGENGHVSLRILSWYHLWPRTTLIGCSKCTRFSTLL